MVIELNSIETRNKFIFITEDNNNNKTGKIKSKYLFFSLSDTLEYQYCGKNTMYKCRFINTSSSLFRT